MHITYQIVFSLIEFFLSVENKFTYKKIQYTVTLLSHCYSLGNNIPLESIIYFIIDFLLHNSRSEFIHTTLQTILKSIIMLLHLTNHKMRVLSSCCYYYYHLSICNQTVLAGSNLKTFLKGMFTKRLLSDCE